MFTNYNHKKNIGKQKFNQNTKCLPIHGWPASRFAGAQICLISFLVKSKRLGMWMRFLFHHRWTKFLQVTPKGGHHCSVAWRTRRRKQTHKEQCQSKTLLGSTKANCASFASPHMRVALSGCFSLARRSKTQFLHEMSCNLNRKSHNFALRIGIYKKS